MNIRLSMAVWVSRLAGFLSRLTGRGGSSLPGLIARRIDPSVLQTLSRRLNRGTVLLTGTNGKTTTAALCRHILENNGSRLVSNRAGANLILGLTAAFVQAERWRVRPRADLALLETDEATMPRAGEETAPRVIAVTNFFRDQLDRYGELSTTVNYVVRGIQHLKEDGVLVLNADDPQVARLARQDRAVIYFGLEGSGSEEDSRYDTLDARFCPQCGAALDYQTRYYAHLGHYRCLACGWFRPRPDVAVERWSREEQTAWVRIGEDLHTFSWRMPGLYNLYNHASAVAVGIALGLAPSAIERALKDFQPAFGRMESLMAGSTRVWLALVKNPVGFNQVLAAVADDPAPSLSALIVINDRYADGRDVSWLWDVDFESYSDQSAVHQWFVSGIRAHDMAVRLKYAGVARDRIHVDPDVVNALTQAIIQAGEGTLYVLPTYTAMLEVRNHLTRIGLVKHFREG